MHLLFLPSNRNMHRHLLIIRRSREEDPVGLFVYDFDMTIDWNDPVRRGRRDALNAMLERNRHMVAMQLRQPSRRDVRRSSTSMAVGNGMMMPTTGRDRGTSIRVNANATTPFGASMGSSGSEYTERRTSRQRPSADGQSFFQYGSGSGKMNEQEERNMLLHHQILNPTVNNAILHGSNANGLLGLSSYRSDSNNSSRHGSISAPGSQSQKSSVAGGGVSMRVSRRESAQTAMHPANTKQPFAGGGGGGGGGEGLIRAPSMHHINQLTRQQSQHLGVARDGRRRTSFLVGHGAPHDNVGMIAPDGDDINAPSPDGSKNPVFLIPEYTDEIWDDDPDLVEARHLISDSFRQQWDKGKCFSDLIQSSYQSLTSNLYVSFHTWYHLIIGHFDRLFGWTL